MNSEGRGLFPGMAGGWGWLPLLLVLLGVGGCGGGAGPAPQDHYYRLRNPEGVERQGRHLLPGVVEVERLGFTGLLGERALVYAAAPQPVELARYHYHFWEDAPADMVGDRLVAWLRLAGVAPRVVTPEVREDPAYQIFGQLRRLERIVAPRPMVVMELELGVRRVRDRRVLLLESYQAEEPQTGDGVEGAVMALERAMGELFGRFVRQLRGL